MLTAVVRQCTKQYLKLEPTTDQHVPAPVPEQRYMLYLHVPFCERLCPYCSFNRFPFAEERAVPYFANLRKEMLMLKDLGYDFDSVYVGGGTPTIMIDELCDTIDLARETFSIKEVSSETNPNHLIPAYLDKLQGRVQRLSVVESGTSQTTFYPLMASPSVARSLARTVGKVDYAREQRFYHIIDELLAGGDDPLFDHGSAWTFNKRETAAASGDAMIDEYVVDYEEYPAIGSGGITYLGNNLYVNTFSVNDYNAAIESGRMSLMGKTTFSKRDRMRYRFMMQLFGLRLDKRQFKEDFGCTVEAGLPVEMAFMRAAGAFDHDDADEVTLTPRGRYLMVVMMRQFFIGVNNLRDQARAALVGEERELIFGE